VKRKAYLYLLIFSLCLWNTSWIYGSNTLSSEISIENSSSFEISFNEKGKKTGRAIFVKNNNEFVYEVTIKTQGSKILKQLNLPEVHFDKVGIVDLSGKGFEDVYFVGLNNSYSRQAKVKDIGLIKTQTGELINLNLSFIPDDLGILHVVEKKNENYVKQHFRLEKEFIEKLRNEDDDFKEFGYLETEESDQKSDYLALAYRMWDKDNDFSEANEGKIKIRKFKGEPSFDASVTTRLEDDNTVYLGYYKSGVIAYDKSYKEFYVLYKPWNYYWWPTVLNKVGPYLFIGTNGEGLVVIDLDLRYLKKIIFGSSFDEIKRIEEYGSFDQTGNVIIRIFDPEENSTDVATITSSVANEKPKIKFTLQPTAVTYYAQGVQLAREKNYQEAIENLKKAIALKSDLGGAYGVLGYCYFMLGQYDLIVKEFEKNLQSRPDFADAYYRLGCAHNRMSSYEKAIENLKEAIRLNPADAYACSELGWAYYQLGQYQEAVDILQEAISINPNQTTPYYYLGLSYLKRGDKDMVQKQYEALKLKDKELADKLYDMMSTKEINE